MRKSVLITLLGATTVFAGCATTKYVRTTEAPIQAKVDQVSDQSNKQGTEINQNQQDIAKNATAISATDEKATAADRHAGDALNKANEADQKADQDSQEIAQLRGVVANLDDYKVVGQTTVLFGVNRAALTKEDKDQIDQAIANSSSMKRYFVAVEGFTDKTGTAAYNLELSKRRADAVVQYLAGEGKVPFYQIRTIGLGEMQPADPGNTREARSKNRRVEVKIFDADATVAGGSTAR